MARSYELGDRSAIGRTVYLPLRTAELRLRRGVHSSRDERCLVTPLVGCPELVLVERADAPQEVELVK